MDALKRRSPGDHMCIHQVCPNRVNIVKASSHASAPVTVDSSIKEDGFNHTTTLGDDNDGRDVIGTQFFEDSNSDREDIGNKLDQMLKVLNDSKTQSNTI